MRRERSSSTKTATTETTMRYARRSPASGRSSPDWKQSRSARLLRDERADDRAHDHQSRVVQSQLCRQLVIYELSVRQCMANSDLNELLNALLPMAEMLLRKQGEFHPIGVTMLSNG